MNAEYIQRLRMEIQIESTLKQRMYWRNMHKMYDDGFSRANRDLKWIIGESTRKDISASQLQTLIWHQKSHLEDMYHLAVCVELCNNVRNITL